MARQLDKCARCGEPAPEAGMPERAEWRAVNFGEDLRAVCPGCQHMSEHFGAQPLDKLD